MEEILLVAVFIDEDADNEDCLTTFFFPFVFESVLSGNVQSIIDESSTFDFLFAGASSSEDRFCLGPFF